MGKFITIVEIARQLGVSHSTVSRALRDNPRISKATRKKVQALAEELGYHANSMANQMSQGRSGIIGVIVPDLSIYFFPKVVEGIQETLEKQGYSMLLFNTQEKLESEVKAIDSCLKHRVDGVLAAISMQTKTFSHFDELIKCEIPLVFFDRVANFLPVPKVVANDHQAAYDATRFLIDSGCSRIAHITGSINLNNSNNRLYGYMDALKDSGFEVIESLIHYYEFEQSSIDKFLVRAVKNYPDFDGLFVFNDYVANYAVNVLSKLGVSIPQDLSVIGFSDEPVATYMTPQLSSVQQVSTRMGKLASEKIMSILDGSDAISDEKIVISQELVLRETTKGKVPGVGTK